MNNDVERRWVDRVKKPEMENFVNGILKWDGVNLDDRDGKLNVKGWKRKRDREEVRDRQNT